MSGDPDHPQGAGDRLERAEELSPTLRRAASATASLDGEPHGPADPDDSDLPRLRSGEQLAGRFTVLRFVARGGMGAVYEANDAMLQTRVALKVLQGRVAADAAAMERFRREVLLARRVSHPNVCRVYELYQATTSTGAPIHFITMEFLDGETLSARLARQGRLTPADALPLVLQMCDGLAAAHAEGVIHRDFKSGNVMLVHRGGDASPAVADGTRVAITDFGIARALEPGGGPPAPDALTGGAGIIGTPDYMAPEQVTGGEVSPSTDLYALGVVIYEMVCGRLPFSGQTPLAVAARRINEPAPRPELAVPDLDPRWSRTIVRCLDRDPRRRFSDAAEIRAALTEAPGMRRPRWILALAAAAVTALVAGGLAWWSRRPAAPTPEVSQTAARASPSIAVLPFADMSAEHDQEYFSDGVAQEIISALSQVPGLHVAARTSSFSFKGKNEDLRTLGQKLAVAQILEGSVRKSGNRLRVTAQLVNVADGYQLWSQSFDRDLADVFGVQDEIARSVVAALKMTSAAPAGSLGRARRPTSPETYAHYLRGLQLYNVGSGAAIRSAGDEFRKAIALDPEFAPAHARLAQATLVFESTADASARQDESKWQRMVVEEADLAIRLDPELVEGYVARGQLRSILTWDWDGAMKDYQQALALSPGDASARALSGHLMAVLGQVPEALASARAAVELDPLSAEAWYHLGDRHAAAGQLALAREALTRALQIAPEHRLALRQFAILDLLDGHPAEALARFQQHPDLWVRQYGTALAQHSLGNPLQSERALQDLRRDNGSAAQYQIAEIHAWRGERELAFEWLERSRVERDPGTRYVKYDPLLRPLRGDPRFAQLLERMHLPPG